MFMIPCYSYVIKTPSTSPIRIYFDRREAPLPLRLSEALGVARLAKGEPAGAGFATRPNRTFRAPSSDDR